MSDNTMKVGDLVKLSKNGRANCGPEWGFSDCPTAIRAIHCQGILTEIDGTKYHVYWIGLDQQGRQRTKVVFDRQELMRIQ
tara:strand:- start:5390 stop:5632 length:243 start_codon:yes stop_codon:yes gene_type:complete